MQPEDNATITYTEVDKAKRQGRNSGLFWALSRKAPLDISDVD
jgi:hypothetical protein